MQPIGMAVISGIDSRNNNQPYVTHGGFPDILTLREAPRRRSFESRLHHPPPFVPRSRTFTVRGRIGASDEELTAVAIRDDDDTVEFTTWKVRAVGVNSARDRRRGTAVAEQQGKLSPKSRRQVYVHAQRGMTQVPVYDGDALGRGAELRRSAIIEEQTFTSLLLDGQTAVVDVHGNYLVNL